MSSYYISKIEEAIEQLSSLAYWTEYKIRTDLNNSEEYIAKREAYQEAKEILENILSLEDKNE